MVVVPFADFIKQNSPAVREQTGCDSNLARSRRERIRRAKLAADSALGKSRLLCGYDFTRNVARNALRELLLVHLPFKPSPWYDCFRA